MLRALRELVQEDTAGDSMTDIKWTHRSLRKLAKALGRRGFQLAPGTVARLLRGLRYSLRTCRKRRAGLRHGDRNRQFQYLTRIRRRFATHGWPVISVDTKKKEWVGDFKNAEWVGDFKNAGRSWRRRPRDVLDHDYPTWAIGQAIPAGIYDLAHNDGYIVVGVSHETPTFMARAIRHWWLVVGRHRYPHARRLLIEADSGGANDHRKWEWKVALQEFADEFGLEITVTHFPPGASKWNPIDHRMFSLI